MVDLSKLLALPLILLQFVIHSQQSTYKQLHDALQLKNVSSLEIPIGGFEEDTVIEESSDPSKSSSTEWWVNSGGGFVTIGGIGKTFHGDSPAGSKWQTAYERTNPTDTDNGLHPQNIFRLVRTGSWANPTQQVYFRINKDNLSDSVQRNDSNGILFFNRYLDGENLYYAGIRVDGSIVVKKKLNGLYYTLGLTQYYLGTYDREKNPNLLPKNTWIGIMSEVYSRENIVLINVYVDPNATGQWELVLEAQDNGGQGELLLEPGNAGIRTDFMDIEFTGYSITEKK